MNGSVEPGPAVVYNHHVLVAAGVPQPADAERLSPSHENAFNWRRVTAEQGGHLSDVRNVCTIKGTQPGLF